MDPATNKITDYAKTAIQPTIQMEARYAPKDDWTGKSNAKERRKMQNRLNQRLYRSRHEVVTAKPREKPNKQTPGPGITEQVAARSQSAGNVSSTIESRPGLPSATLPPDAALQTLKSPTMCGLSLEQKQVLIADFNERIHRSSVAASPRLDMLLTLVHFNVFRALISNTVSTGFDMAWLGADAVSPFYTAESGWSAGSCPPHLLPTRLQQTVEHHPWIDLFPFPAMQDNLPIADGEYDEDQLCIDLVEFCHVPYEQTGLIVWGEPGDPKGWEVSETFLTKGSWILNGCHEIHESTNYWRELRGEEGLVWEF